MNLPLGERKATSASSRGKMDSRGLSGPRPGLPGFIAREQVRKEPETPHEP
jgi:hypothetical protein